MLPSIIDAGERDPDVAPVQTTLQEICAAEVLGPLYYGRWFTRQPIDSAFLDRIVSSVCGSLSNTSSHLSSQTAGS